MMTPEATLSTNKKKQSAPKSQVGTPKDITIISGFESHHKSSTIKWGILLFSVVNFTRSIQKTNSFQPLAFTPAHL
jgi:hypothetical protein